MQAVRFGLWGRPGLDALTPFSRKVTKVRRIRSICECAVLLSSLFGFPMNRGHEKRSDLGIAPYAGYNPTVTRRA